MTIRQKADARIDIDNRYRVVFRRSASTATHAAQLALQIYPITNGEVWDEPYDYETISLECDCLRGNFNCVNEKAQGLTTIVLSTLDCSYCGFPKTH